MVSLKVIPLALSALLCCYAAVFPNPGINKIACPADGVVDDERCCVWHQIRNDLQSNNFFLQCGFDVPDMLRLAFHDAISFSLLNPSAGGGADGSMLAFPGELEYAENIELIGGAQELVPFLKRYNVSAGDMIQFAAMTGTSNCPGSPKFKFLAGRPPPKFQAPDGFVPSASDSVTKILLRMAEAGLTPQDTVALLASHSIGRADNVDLMIPGAAFDTTPQALDGQFFLEVLLKATGWPGTVDIDPSSGETKSGMVPQGEIRLHSDSELARDPLTSCIWQSYIDNAAKLATDFGNAMYKVSMIGQDRFLGQMYDCSGALPTPPPFPRKTTYPGGYSFKDIDKSCLLPFPSLATDPGVAPKIPPDIDLLD